jgi:hypothetical protein
MKEENPLNDLKIQKDLNLMVNELEEQFNTPNEGGNRSTKKGSKKVSTFY